VAEERITHKERNIVVRVPEGGIPGRGNEPGDAHGLFIDGQYIATERHSSGRFWTHRLPYQDFESLADLGKALIDHDEV
jgi:hypothetical protein